MRNHRALALALVAILAVMAITASAASAVEYHGEQETVEVESEQIIKNVLTIPKAGTVECTTALVVGTVKGTKKGAGDYVSTSMTVKPNFSECNAFGFAKADVNTEGCFYKINELAAGAPPTGNLHYTCEAGKEITITPTSFGVSACTLKLRTDTPTTPTVDLTNQGATNLRDLLLRWTLAGIKHSPGCGTNLEAADGTYTGTQTLKGFEPATLNRIGFWVE